MTKQEAKRIAYSVICMVIQDSNAYNLIANWAKDKGEITQLQDALTEVRDLLERRAGMADNDKPNNPLVESVTDSLFDNGVAVTETEADSK